MRFSKVSLLIVFLLSLSTSPIAEARTPQSPLYLELSSRAKGNVLINVGNATVNMFSIDLSADCNTTATISQLTLKHIGKGSSKEITGVYAISNGKNVSDKPWVDPKTLSVTLNFTPPLVLGKCQTLPLDVFADFATFTAGGVHRFELTDIVAEEKNGEWFTGGHLLKGKLVTIADVPPAVMSRSDCYKNAFGGLISSRRALARKACRASK